MIHTDAVVIGAGPAGLFQVFQLGLLGLQAHVVDALPEPGGQCVALYPDKPIYDIPGLPACTGRSLTAQLLDQASPFLDADRLHLGQQVTRLEVSAQVPLGQHRFTLHTDQGLALCARVVFVAAGAGAFLPRELALPGLKGRPGNLHHHLHADSGAPAPWAGQHLTVAGGGDEALHAVLSLLQAPSPQAPAHITLLHRRDQFQAEPALDAAVREAMQQGRMHLVLGVPQSVQQADDGRLLAIDLAQADGTHTHPTDHLLVQLGLSPKLGPLADWGLPMARKQVGVDPATFASGVPGVFAVGDINTYPGKKRLLLCAFHEATLAAHAAAALLNPDAPQHLLYTTTSPLLLQRLGRA
jgi:thioredoxin reductase (NADPH)